MRRTVAALGALLAAGPVAATPQVPEFQTQTPLPLPEKTKRAFSRANPCDEAVRRFEQQRISTTPLAQPKFGVYFQPLRLQVDFVHEGKPRQVIMPLEKSDLVAAGSTSRINLLRRHAQMGTLQAFAYQPMTMQASTGLVPPTRFAVVFPDFKRGVCLSALETEMPEPIPPMVVGEHLSR